MYSSQEYNQGSTVGVGENSNRTSYISTLNRVSIAVDPECHPEVSKKGSPSESRKDLVGAFLGWQHMGEPCYGLLCEVTWSLTVEPGGGQMNGFQEALKGFR